METKAPAGYQKDDQEYKVRFAYEDDDHTEVVKVRQKVQNVKVGSRDTAEDRRWDAAWRMAARAASFSRDFATGVGLTLRRKSWMQKHIE